MKVEKIENIKPGNPFLSDPYNMGIKIGSNITIMFGKFENDIHEYIIIVNTLTGNRLRINFDEKGR